MLKKIPYCITGIKLGEHAHHMNPCNIVKSGIKHYKPNQTCEFILILFFLRFCLIALWIGY